MNESELVQKLMRKVNDLDDGLLAAQSRIEAIEKRQAILACSETSAFADDGEAKETRDWDKLATMLGMETVAWMIGFMSQVNMYGFEDEEKIERNLKAMLIGLAEEECNGNVWLARYIPSKDTDWCWSLGGDEYVTGRGLSRPAAAIDMLIAYREANR